MHINVEQIATESFLRSSVRVDHEKPTKKSSKNFDLGKPVFSQIQNGRHVSKIRNLQPKNHNFFVKGSSFLRHVSHFGFGQKRAFQGRNIWNFFLWVFHDLL